MKYIKTFEKTVFYSIGDYIKLTDESQLNIPIYKIIKILDILSFNEKYVIEIISGDKIYTNKQLNIYSEIIERLATPEEIENYEALKSTIKYNL